MSAQDGRYTGFGGLGFYGLEGRGLDSNIDSAFDVI